MFLTSSNSWVSSAWMVLHLASPQVIVSSLEIWVIIRGRGSKVKGKMCIFLTLLRLVVLTNFYSFFSTSPACLFLFRFWNRGTLVSNVLSFEALLITVKMQEKWLGWLLITMTWLEMNSWQCSSHYGNLGVNCCNMLDYWVTGWGAYSTTPWALGRVPIGTPPDKF